MSAVKKHSMLLVALAFIAFISLGLPDTVSGVAWPSIRNSFGLPQSGLALMLAGAMAGYIASSLYTAALLNRMRLGTLLAVSTVLVATGLLGYATIPVWLMYPVFALFTGFGSGAIDTALNLYAARNFSLRQMNWLHGFYTIGAAIGPMIMTAVLVEDLSYRWGYAILCMMLLLLAGAFGATRGWWGGPAEIHPDKPVEKVANTLEASRHFTILHNAFVFMLIAGCEATFGQWCFTVFTELRGFSEGAAGYVVTQYWVVFAAGRLALGALAGHIGGVRLLRYGMLLSAMGAALFAFGSAPIAAFGVALAGLGLAPAYPTLMSRTPELVGHRFAAAAIGMQVTAAVIGAAALPSLAGLLGQRLGLGTIGIYVTVLCTVMFLSNEALFLAKRPA